MIAGSTGAGLRIPFIESVIPSAWDPTVAPPGQHWMSNFVQYCPPQLADGPMDRGEAGRLWPDRRRQD